MEPDIQTQTVKRVWIVNKSEQMYVIMLDIWQILSEIHLFSQRPEEETKSQGNKRGIKERKAIPIDQVAQR